MSFTLPIRVYWEDTDAGAIVFYANYLKYMERARTEWLRSLGISQQALKLETGGMFVVTDTQLKYTSPARLDDLLIVSAQIIEAGRSRLKLIQEISLQPAQNMRGPLSNHEQVGATQPHFADLAPSQASHSRATAICQGTICIAWVDAGTLKPGRIPSQLSEKLI